MNILTKCKLIEKEKKITGQYLECAILFSHVFNKLARKCLYTIQLLSNSIDTLQGSQRSGSTPEKYLAFFLHLEGDQYSNMNCSARLRPSARLVSWLYFWKVWIKQSFTELHCRLMPGSAGRGGPCWLHFINHCQYICGRVYILVARAIFYAIYVARAQTNFTHFFVLKIPLTGDTNSLNRCG